MDDYKERVFISSQGDTIQYRLFIPLDYKPDTKYPLVLFHHGGGGGLLRVDGRRLPQPHGGQAALLPPGTPPSPALVWHPRYGGEY